VLLASLAVASCAREERVVNYKPFFSGLENVQTQQPAVAEKRGDGSGPISVTDDPSKFSIVKENPDGTKTLISHSGLHLMTHIQKTLADNDQKLFTEQVLSQMTRDEFKDRGLDPAQAFTYLKPHEKDIAKMFSRMPLGEHSPNVNMETVGRNLFRVKLTGKSTEGLDPWTGFDMVLEKGNWKLRWFVP
jgi:hypothetical protein